MTKKEFFALYAAIEQFCNGNQAQAKRLYDLMHNNYHVVASGVAWSEDGKSYLIDPYHRHECSNGINRLRSYLLLELYSKFGSAYEQAWRSGSVGLRYWSKANGPEYYAPLEANEMERQGYN